jgi:hypothetical protein
LLRQKALVFVFVTIGAQKLPVASIGRVVIVVVIAMMDFEQLQVGVRELAAAASTYPRINPECLLTVTLCALFACAPCLGDNAVKASMIRSSFRAWHLRLPSSSVPFTISEGSTKTKS